MTSSFDVAGANLLQQAYIFGHEARTADDLGSEIWGQFVLRAVPEQHSEYLEVSSNRLARAGNL